GLYLLPNLPTGPYKLQVSLQGFRTYDRSGIVLQVGATPTINVVLAVGNIEETVSVEGAAPLVDVRSSGISSVVENERILELPLVQACLKVRCMLSRLPVLISCLIWLGLVGSLPLIRETMLVIILLLQFLSLMLGSVLVLMPPLLVWLTPYVGSKKSLLYCNS